MPGEPLPPHDTFTLDSAVLAEARRINVYTPPGDADAGLSVLYVLDGGAAEDFPHVTAAMDAAIRAGEMRPVRAVGIENTERRRDMTPPTEVDEDRRIAPRVGGSAAFRRFLAEELMPQVARRYRVSGDAAIIGESLAGLFVVETFLLRPELFRTYAALSPSLWWNAGELVRTAGERMMEHGDVLADRTLYLSAADEEHIVRETARLADVLRAHAPPSLRWSYHPRPELTHATIYRAAAPSVLCEMFPPRAVHPAGAPGAAG